MKRIILLVFLLAGLARAQTSSSTITASTCMQINVYGKGSVGINVKNSGTAWSGTIQPQVIIDADPNGTTGNATVTPSTSSTAQATITANGTYYASVAGANYFQLCGNTVTNIAAIIMTPVPLSANRNAGTGSGSVTSVTFTGDGTVLSSTPSAAVTTSGTVTAALATAGGGTVLGNNTTSTAAPTYTVAPVLGIPGTSMGTLALASSTASGKFTLAVPASAATPTLTLPTTSNVLAGQFAGDGVVLNSTLATASAAGTVTAALANAGAGTLLGNVTSSAAAPTYTSTPSIGAVGGTTGSLTFLGTTSGSGTFGCSGATCVAFSLNSSLQGLTNLSTALYSSTTNCSGVGTAANPSVVTCAAAPAGAFSCATAASTGTCQVNTTAAGTNSDIVITQTASAGARLSVTCNTTADAPAGPRILSINNGVSFTINLGTVTTNPTCYLYTIINK